jgi:peptidoglycan/LPS O-acetylase OafA/YrhL
VPTQIAPREDHALPPAGEEAGTAPGDRRFRPDVEGLRALAIAAVVLYHAGVPHLTGGYVGVDVFFVISGFVITGLLLRERGEENGTSILNFYARRIRRILPAATVVILVVVVATFLLLGTAAGVSTANDGRWAAVFLSNFHFAAVGTDYLTAQLPPSPLQNFWSLSVEEQFYLVYPTLFLVIASVRGPLSVRTRLAIALTAIIIASYWLSITQTAAHPTTAYFSPFCRAWELALGALIAVGTTTFTRLPRRTAALMTWVGLGCIVIGVVTFGAHTPYPGSLVAVPVVGAAAVIAGGTALPPRGAESLLGVRPLGWLGRRSYSLYLWHWPILVIAADHAVKQSLPVPENLALVGVAVGLSMLSYRIVENPIRHLKAPPRKTVVVGAVLIVATVVVLSATISTESVGAGSAPVDAAPSVRAEHHLVMAASRITTVPWNVQPSLSATQLSDWGGSYIPGRCGVPMPASSEKICQLGDPKGKDLIVAYGDSHAAMWVPALIWIAKTSHWRLVVLSKSFCPAEPVTIANPAALGAPNTPDVVCNRWHSWAIHWINRHRPQVLVISQMTIYQSPVPGGTAATWFSNAQWRAGLVDLYASLTDKQTRNVILGDIPVPGAPGPQCLAQHRSDVQACSSPAVRAIPKTNAVEALTARSLGVDYIDTVPWLCSATCTAMISKYIMYYDQVHIGATGARFLRVVLGEALHLGRS